MQAQTTSLVTNERKRDGDTQNRKNAIVTCRSRKGEIGRGGGNAEMEIGERVTLGSFANNSIEIDENQEISVDSGIGSDLIATEVQVLGVGTETEAESTQIGQQNINDENNANDQLSSSQSSSSPQSSSSDAFSYEWLGSKTSNSSNNKTATDNHHLDKTHYNLDDHRIESKEIQSTPKPSEYDDGSTENLTNTSNQSILCGGTLKMKPFSAPSSTSTVPKQAYTPSSSRATSSSSSLKAYRQQEQRNPRGIYATMRKLYANKELYKGATPVATTLAISNFVFFYALQFTKKVLNTKNGASLLASTIAGIFNVLITNPLWLANLRLIQSKDYDINADASDISHQHRTHVHHRRRMSLWKMLRHIIKHQGIKELWNGTSTSLILVSNPAIQYYVYERWKYEIISSRKSSLLSSSLRQGKLNEFTSIEAFFVGAIAKGIATVVTYPLQLAQVLMRLQSSKCSSGGNNDTKTQEKAEDDSEDELYFTGTMNCMVQLYKTGGIQALYSGMDAKLLQTVLTSALTFLTYEQIVNIVAKTYVSLLTARHM